MHLVYMHVGVFDGAKVTYHFKSEKLLKKKQGKSLFFYYYIYLENPLY